MATGDPDGIWADHQQSVRTVVDDSGALVNSIDYDGFGKIMTVPPGVSAHDSGDGAVGSADGNWDVRRTSGSGGATNWTAATIVTGSGLWMQPDEATDSTNHWIAFDSTFQGGDSSTFEYRTTINVASGTSSVPLMLASDNAILSVTVTDSNGTSTDAGITMGTPGAEEYGTFEHWHAFELSNPPAGDDTITFEVQNVTSASGLLVHFGGNLQRFMYTGQEHDGETGLDYYGARYYDAGTGGFILRCVHSGEVATRACFGDGGFVAGGFGAGNGGRSGCRGR
jgi:RHS repeat-associated protein